MLSPKRTKFRKSFKYTKKKGIVSNNNIFNFGSFGLKSLETGRISNRQIESARRAITRKMQREGRLWIHIFPHISVTSKPTEVRMGKGKGSVSYWAALIKPGKLLFEIDGISMELAQQALRYGAGKLPIKTRFIKKTDHFI